MSYRTLRCVGGVFDGRRVEVHDGMTSVFLNAMEPCPIGPVKSYSPKDFAGTVVEYSLRLVTTPEKEKIEFLAPAHWTDTQVMIRQFG